MKTVIAAIVLQIMIVSFCAAQGESRINLYSVWRTSVLNKVNSIQLSNNKIWLKRNYFVSIKRIDSVSFNRAFNKLKMREHYDYCFIFYISSGEVYSQQLNIIDMRSDSNNQVMYKHDEGGEEEYSVSTNAVVRSLIKKLDSKKWGNNYGSDVVFVTHIDESNIATNIFPVGMENYSIVGRIIGSIR